MDNVSLFIIGDHHGGIGAFTSNLAMLLCQYMCDVEVYKIGKRTMRSIYNIRGDNDVTYSIMHPDDMLRMAETRPCLMTYVADYKKSNNLAQACRLADAGVPAAIHDRRAAYPEMKHASAIVCSEAAVNYLTSEYGYTDVMEIPQPYHHVTTTLPKPLYNGVMMTRVDFEKHVEMVLEANDILEEGEQIKIFGRVDRRYEYWRLRESYPAWRRHYGGTPEDLEMSAVQICALGRFVVDMSTLEGDGGRTQYSFFEAMNAGSTLVINREWLQYPGCMEEGVNCLAVENAEELAAVLKRASRLMDTDGIFELCASEQAAERWYDALYSIWRGYGA
jgi:hypothetical protein